MLYEFVTTYRDEIITKTRVKVSTRPWPPASTAELDNGLPMFLTQLAETLRWENTDTPFSTQAIGNSATRHGRDLFALGFTVSQVVHDYGDICQAITELDCRPECADHDARIPHLESVPRHGHCGRRN
jgi:hypothetical protein